MLVRVGEAARPERVCWPATPLPTPFFFLLLFLLPRSGAQVGQALGTRRTPKLMPTLAEESCAALKQLVD